MVFWHHFLYMYIFYPWFFDIIFWKWYSCMTSTMHFLAIQHNVPNSQADPEDGWMQRMIWKIWAYQVWWKNGDSPCTTGICMSLTALTYVDICWGLSCHGKVRELKDPGATIWMPRQAHSLYWTNCTTRRQTLLLLIGKQVWNSSEMVKSAKSMSHRC